MAASRLLNPFASLASFAVERLFGAEIQRRAALAVRALDDAHDRQYAARNSKYASDRDRYSYNREELLTQCLDAWRDNPLARRIVELTSDYVVGGGIGIEAKDKAAHDFLDEWWNHRLNHMAVRCFEWCDELTRSGEIFPVISTDASGMSYVRAIPALDIQAIESAPNDIEQERSFIQRPMEAGADPIIWRAYDEQTDAPVETPGSGPSFPPVMLHYAINRPVGAQRGESDLAPLLKWLMRYSAWLEDRVRLNRFRQVFLYWVHRVFGNEAERLRRQADLNANPPNPGSILVTDDEEKWEVLQPRLDAFEAKEDGLAVKKMIASGAGIPMHFLAEPESATRTTAEASGGPTFRHYGRRQEFFLFMIADIARIVLRRRSFVDRRVDPDTVLRLKGTDISVRDNAMLAEAASKVVSAFAGLRDRGLITEEAGNDHTIYVHLTDADGRPAPGVIVRHGWPTIEKPDETIQGKTNSLGEINWAMWDDSIINEKHPRGPYWIKVVGNPSTALRSPANLAGRAAQGGQTPREGSVEGDTVDGMGLPALRHVNYRLFFRWTPDAAEPPDAGEDPAEPPPSPEPDFWSKARAMGRDLPPIKFALMTYAGQSFRVTRTGDRGIVAVGVEQPGAIFLMAAAEVIKS